MKRSGWSRRRKYRAEKDLFPWPVSSLDTLSNKTGLWRFLRPIFEDKIAPCDHACFAGQRVRDFIDAASDGRFYDGYLILKESNPFPEITGRICPHPCTEECSRNRLDISINIPMLESHIGEIVGKKAKKLSIRKKEFSKKVAIIGSGPAGLSCAYHLLRNDIKPVIFEKDPSPGGMLRYAIPSYRLPKAILDESIEKLVSEGVEIKTGVSVGSDISWEELNEFDAVFISAGSHISKKINIEGEDEEGVFYALNFLRMVNSKVEFEIGRRVAVIGGGNSAVDVARTARRMGSEEVYIICVEPKDRMPAIRDEIYEAEKEGVLIKDRNALIRIKREDNLLNLQLARATFIRRKPDGGIEFKIDYESKKDMKVDNVIIAIGETPDTDFIPPDLSIKRRKNPSMLAVCTNKKGFFAGGDFVSGPSYASLAVSWGRVGAEAIRAFIEKRKIVKSDDKRAIVDIKKLRFHYFVSIPFKDQLKNIVSRIDILNESRRCLKCGKCIGCGNCYIFCPDNAIRIHNNKLEIIYDYCKGCGICVRECPRDAMSLIEEIES